MYFSILCLLCLVNGENYIGKNAVITFDDGKSLQAICNCDVPGLAQEGSNNSTSLPCDPIGADILVRYPPNITGQDVVDQLQRKLVNTVEGAPLLSTELSNLTCTDSRNEKGGVYYPGGDLGVVLLLLNTVSSFNVLQEDQIKQLLKSMLESHTMTGMAPDFEYCTDNIAASNMAVALNYATPSVDHRERLLTYVDKAPNTGNFWWNAVLLNSFDFGFYADPTLPSKLVRAFHELLWEGTKNTGVSIQYTNETNDPYVFVEIRDGASCERENKVISVSERTFEPEEGALNLQYRFWHSVSSLQTRMKYAALLKDALHQNDLMKPPLTDDSLTLSLLLSREFNQSAIIMDRISTQMIEQGEVTSVMSVNFHSFGEQEEKPTPPAVNAIVPDNHTAGHTSVMDAIIPPDEQSQSMASQ